MKGPVATARAEGPARPPSSRRATKRSPSQRREAAGGAARRSADHERLASWAMQHQASGLALIRGVRIAAANAAFDELARALRATLVRHLPEPRPGGVAPGRPVTLRAAIEAEARAAAATPGSAGRHLRFRALGSRWVELLLERSAPTGDEPFTVAVVRDITPQVRSEAELLAAQEALARQEHMGALGELAAGIAHDVSNTLGAIRLRLSALRRDPACLSSQGPNIEALERIVTEGTSMLLKLQRLGQSTDTEAPVPVDLGESIAGAVEIAQSGLRYRALHEGVDIRIERDLPPLPRINAWPTDLQRVFVNLLINARDAMPRGGRIRITGKVTREHIVIEIEDDGPGIAPNAMPRIFEPYFTTKGTAGTGIGLAMAQRALARLGGSISGSNRAGGGARFALRFPIVGIPAEAGAGAKPRPPGAGG